MTLAYLDSFAGMVPCRIVAVGDWNDRYSEARIRFTATRGPYPRGEYDTFPLHRVVPRNAVFRRHGCLMIRRYRWPLADRTTL